MCKIQKVRVIIYFSGSSLLRKEGEIMAGNETRIIVLRSLTNIEQ